MTNLKTGTMRTKAAIVGLSSLFILVSRPSFGQAPAKLEFEVATIKPSQKGTSGIPLHPEPGGCGRDTWN